MKYHNLYINTSNEIIYHKVSKLLNKLPKEHENEIEFNLWMYQVVTEDDKPYFDFINNFLDFIEPNLKALKDLGIDISDITIWLVYEYEHQCAMEFNPQEMKRLGDSGIVFCIDCLKK
jgi:hypothetical protein